MIRTVRELKNGDWLLVAQQASAEVMAPIRAALLRRDGGSSPSAWVVIVAVAVLTTRYLVRWIQLLSEQRQQLNAQLVRAGKLASLGEMATGIAHEINNPLGIIYSEQTNISDLLGELSDDERIAEMRANVAMTKKQVGRCKTITQKMLQFGRQSLAAAQEIDVAAQLREIVDLVEQHARVNDIDVCLEAEPDLPPVVFDPGEFQQVVTNLFNNAVQATSDSGAVRISAWREGRSVWIEVEDTGPGIPPDVLPRIFEPFFTTKPVGKGTGLGLSVCFGIVSQWQGEITVESPAAGGACFRIRIPTAVAARQRGRSLTQGESDEQHTRCDLGPARRRRRGFPGLDDPGARTARDAGLQVVEQRVRLQDARKDPRRGRGPGPEDAQDGRTPALRGVSRADAERAGHHPDRPRRHAGRVRQGQEGRLRVPVQAVRGRGP